MEHSDEKIDIPGEPEVNKSVKSDDGITAPDKPCSGGDNVCDNTSSDIGETISVAVKTVAVALSVIIMLTVILAIGLPLTTMRIFNKLGNSERAIDFGERYISRRLSAADALATDSYGNYTELMRNAELSDAEFEEAVYVCTNLSYKLMESAYSSGDTRRGEYYAAITEKYTRIYLSMYNSSALFDAKSRQAIYGLPYAALRPTVYNYGQTIRAMNFRARAHLGQTQNMASNSQSYDRGYIIAISELSTVSNVQPTDPNDRNAIMSIVDNFVSYVDQLCEYLDVEFKRIGVESDLSKKVDMTDANGNELLNVPVVSETYILSNYENIFSGNEFGLFIRRNEYDKSIAFTPIYESLKRFPYYAQLAVDFLPDDRAGNKADEQLHQLYWLQKLDNAAQSLLYMEWLLQHNDEMFGRDGMDIIAAENGTCQAYRSVTVKNAQGVDSVTQIINVYTQKMKEYLSV